MSSTVVPQPVLRGHENQLGRLQRLGHRDRDAVGVDAVRLPVAVEAERRNHRNQTLVQQGLKKFHIQTLDLSGEQLVDAMNDPERMRDDGIRAGRAQVVGRKTLQDLVRETVRGIDGEFQCRRVGDAGAIEVRRLDSLPFGESLNLLRRAVDQHHADVQGTQHRHVQEDVGEVFVRDDASVHRDDECLFAELRDVLENPAQVG